MEIRNLTDEQLAEYIGRDATPEIAARVRRYMEDAEYGDTAAVPEATWQRFVECAAGRYSFRTDAASGPLTAAARPIYAAVVAVMQTAEDIGGPEGAEYVALMEAIAAEAQERIRNCRQWHAPDFQTPITTREGAEAYIRALNDAGMLYHFDDDPSDIPVFRGMDHAAILARAAELKAIPDFDPFDYAMALP